MELLGYLMKPSRNKGAKSNRPLPIKDVPRRLPTSDVVRRSDYEDDLIQDLRRALPRPEPTENRYYSVMLPPAGGFIRQTVARLQNEISSQQDQHSLQIGKMESKHTGTVERLEKSLEEGGKRLHRLEETHDQEKQRTIAKHENELSEIRRRQQRSIEEGNERLQSLQRKHDQEIQIITARHKNELSEMHSRLQNLQGQHDWQVQNIASEHRNELSVVYGNHERRMDETKVQHAKQIEKTQRSHAQERLKFEQEATDMRNNHAVAIDQAAREKQDMIEVYETEKLSLQDEFERDRDEKEREYHTRERALVAQIEERNDALLARDDDSYKAKMFTTSSLPQNSDEKLRGSFSEIDKAVDDLSRLDWRPGQRVFRDQDLERL